MRSSVRMRQLSSADRGGGEYGGGDGDVEGGGWVLGADDIADILADVGDEEEIGEENDDDEARKAR